MNKLTDNPVKGLRFVAPFHKDEVHRNPSGDNEAAKAWR